MSVKDEFHHFIDKIENEKVLKGYLELIKHLNDDETGKSWKNLNPEEQEELMLSYQESLDTDHLLNHEIVKEQHSKWLRK